MARDIGGYFDRMTKKARGGRRLEGEGVDVPPYEPTDEPAGSSTPSSARPAPRRGGGITDVLKDIVGRGRTTATSTKKAAEKATKKATKKAAEKARTTLDRRRSPKGGVATSLPREGVVTIEYSPRIDGDPDPGEVVWAWVPYEEDPEQGKDRPVVVIGRRGRKLVGVPLTTKRDDREAQISVGTGDWDPKRRSSYARIWRMLDIEAGDARREGAVLERRRFDQVVTAVDRYYEVRRPATKTGSARADSDDFEFDY